MNISSKFRQNTFQLALLLLGSIASMLISIWVTIMAYSSGNADTFQMLPPPNYTIIQLYWFSSTIFACLSFDTMDKSFLDYPFTRKHPYYCSSCF